MANLAQLSSGIFSPLLSIYSIIDTDLGLLNYVFKEFRNEEVFDLNILDYYELINKVYYRQFQNPLYVIMKDPDNEEHKKLLDDCYEEFIVDKEAEILDNSLSTQIAELINMFRAEGNIKPAILYYTNAQLDYIESIIEFDEIPRIPVTDLESSAKKFDMFYLKYLEELNLFRDLKAKSFYVSDCGLNLNENRNDFRDYDVLYNMIENSNDVYLYNLYRGDIIGKDSYKNGK